MTKDEINAVWESTCGDIEQGIIVALVTVLAKQKGKTALETRIEFFTNVAKLAFEAGCEIGYRFAKDKYKP